MGDCKSMIGYIDMDGVLCDMVKASSELFNIPNPYLNPKNLGTFNIWDVSDISASMFWKGLDNPDFWPNIPWHEDGKEILRLMEQTFEETVLLTSPGTCASAYTGKFEWVEKNLPGYRRRMIVSPCKWMCSHPKGFLLDDKPKNIEKWCERERGGYGYLLPRPWNSRYVLDPVKSLESTLGDFERFMSSWR